jgi:hypothetical protein
MSEIGDKTGAPAYRQCPHREAQETNAGPGVAARGPPAHRNTEKNIRPRVLSFCMTYHHHGRHPRFPAWPVTRPPTQPCSSRRSPSAKPLYEILSKPAQNTGESALVDAAETPWPSRSQGGFPPNPTPDWESGRRYMTKAGFRVRSKAEKIIADYLTESGIRFVYEPHLRVGAQMMRPDFYLIDYDLPYEHFGLDTADYLQGAARKMARYRAAGIPFMYTTFRDEPDIEDVIVDKLAEATLDL